MVAKNIIPGLILSLLAGAVMLALVKRQTDGQDIVPGRKLPTPTPTSTPVGTSNKPKPKTTPTPTSKTKPKPATTPKPMPTPAPTPVPTPKSATGTVKTNSSIEFVRIPAGEFMMGSTNGSDTEKPVHLVRISHGFEIGKYEVTQAQWEAVMGNNPSHFKGLDMPIETVSWDDVQQFMQALNARNDGYIYQLPTEAEWEYACRAGTTGDSAGNLDEIGWYADNSGRQRLNASEIFEKERGNFNIRLYENGCQTHTVGQKQPNAFGLYDMQGNVGEWCQDWYDKDYYKNSPTLDPEGPGSGSSRVIRGGSWSFTVARCRSAIRSFSQPGLRSNNLGFRLVRTAGVRTSNSIEFVRIPAGEFMMGSTNGSDAEKPVHLVRISRGFEIGKYEVTQAQWEAVMGNNPSHFKGENLPVESVSWEDAQEFISKLNARNDRYKYRLPTEAEWEYACRAGSKGDYAGKLDEMGWYEANADNRTHPVGQKRPNAWGLYDMHGNVWEWVQDSYDQNYYNNSPMTDPQGPNTGYRRVDRGGSWHSTAERSRSAERGSDPPRFIDTDVGFRLVRALR